MRSQRSVNVYWIEVVERFLNVTKKDAASFVGELMSRFIAFLCPKSTLEWNWTIIRSFVDVAPPIVTNLGVVLPPDGSCANWISESFFERNGE